MKIQYIDTIATKADWIELPRLSIFEIRYAAFHAIDRRTHALAHRRRDKTDINNYTWTNEVESTCAELAFAKWLNECWTGLAGRGFPDCGEVDIRWTEYDNRTRFSKNGEAGGLIAYAGDLDDRRLVLVDGFAPSLRAIGWALAGEVKREEFWHPPENDQSCGYWLMPRRLLHAIKKAAGLQIPAAPNGEPMS